MADTIKLYDINDGLVGRVGTYADIEERKAAETRRAEIEGREPDYDNPGAVAGTVLVSASQLLAANGVNIPSTADTKTQDDQAMVEAIAATETSTISAQAEIPVESEEGEEEVPEEPPKPGQGPKDETVPAEETPAEQPAETPTETPAEDPFAGTEASSNP